ncbi:hypothetical protein NEOKW01_0926 [Nematocida sp. AWRm80]|nr:hypothetical protein NEOKW01_0926 [Nematocida sp. AWRm80]
MDQSKIRWISLVSLYFLFVLGKAETEKEKSTWDYEWSINTILPQRNLISPTFKTKEIHWNLAVKEIKNTKYIYLLAHTNKSDLKIETEVQWQYKDENILNIAKVEIETTNQIAMKLPTDKLDKISNISIRINEKAKNAIKKQVTLPRGLPNYNATCYCNALIQALYNVKSFREIVLNDTTIPQTEEYKYFNSLKALFNYIKTGARKTGNLTIKNAIKIVRLGADGSHEDPSEVFVKMMDGLVDKKANESKDIKDIKSKIYDIFYYQYLDMKIKKTPPTAKNGIPINQSGTASYIHIMLNKNISATNPKISTLEEHLNYEKEMKHISDAEDTTAKANSNPLSNPSSSTKSDKSKEKSSKTTKKDDKSPLISTSSSSSSEESSTTTENPTPPEETKKHIPPDEYLEESVQYMTLPEAMIFCIKRTVYDKRKHTTYKKNDFFSFPPVLDMKDYMYNFHKPRKNYTYYLASIIVHIGGHDGGHYYSYVNLDNGWAYCNDNEVKMIDNPYKEIFSEKIFGGSTGRNTYMLVYVDKEKQTMFIDPKAMQTIEYKDTNTK